MQEFLLSMYLRQARRNMKLCHHCCFSFIISSQQMNLFPSMSTYHFVKGVMST